MSPLREVYWIVPGSIIFFVLLAVSLGVFSNRLYRLYRILKLGKPDIRWGQVWERFRVAFGRVFAQICTLREFSLKDRSGLGHFFIFWAFVLFSSSYIFLVGDGLKDSFSRQVMGDPLHNVYYLALEILGVLVILATIVAAIRRYILKPARLSQTADAAYILSFIFFLMVTSFLAEGLGLVANSTLSPWTPVAQAVANVFSGLSSGTARTLYDVFWWVHMALLLGFMAYIPYSKHLHIILSPFNIFLRALRPEGGLKLLDYQSAGDFGVSRIQDFTWKQLLDLYTCTECGRCQENCPAWLTGKVLSPKKIIVDMKEHLLERGQQLISGPKSDEKTPALVGEVVAEQAIWDCTTCRACQESCPVFIEHIDKIVDMRRSLVLMQAKFPEEVQPLFENTEQRSNPWGIAPAERAKWAADTDARPYTAGQTEYLFYVGCAGAFDARNRKKTLALAKILDAAGVSWGILGKDELCCGDSMRRLGNEYVFDVIARGNIKMFQDKGIRKIITQCPHCYSTFKNDYRQFGADFEIVNHVEFINELIKAGRLELAQNTQVGKVVFHDSCYLGRHNKVYAAPRQATAAATGQAPAEMPRNHGRSFCCGAGGGRMWMEERQGKRINAARVEEALKESPDTLCVSCPYCLIMFEDGLKDANASEKVRVLDVAEIVAGAIKQPGPQPQLETAAAH